MSIGNRNGNQPARIRAEQMGVRFLFDRNRRVATKTMARFRRRGDEIWGLRDVSFSIGRGEGIALIGPSGAGKTTLLRLIAGILAPDSGRIEVAGRVGSLLSPEAGLLNVLTGRESARLLAVLAGLSRAEAAAALEEIREASGLGAAFDRPVSAYSEGMRAQLGFAVAEQARPQIILLDEVHEALDERFRLRVERRCEATLAGGGIVVAAGHDHPLLERFCSRALLFREGRLVDDGPFDRIAGEYARATASQAEAR
jgi:ABC-type polysaccharide/polyol phosphate transport system ATPase subunit